MNSTVETVALVNSFNRCALLQEALTSLIKALSELDGGGAIVVFDAGSTDGSQEWLKETAAQSAVPISLIFADEQEDRSFSAGVNRAAQHALASFPDTKWLFLYETDNWIAGAGPIKEAIKVLEANDRVAAVGFTVRKHSGAAIAYGEPFPKVWEFVIGPQFAPYLTRRQSRQESGAWFFGDIVYTSPLLVRISAWEQSKGLDAQTFPFSDCDLDWAWRLKEQGWRQAVLVTDAVVHDNRESPSSWSRLRVIGWHRARLQLLCRHAGVRADFLKPLLFVRHCVEFFVLLVLVGRKDRLFSLEKRIMLMRTVFSGYES